MSTHASQTCLSLGITLQQVILHLVFIRLSPTHRQRMNSLLVNAVQRQDF